MTGWVKFSSEETGYYRSKKAEGEREEWPPKYCKFLLKFGKEEVEGEEREEVEVAFVDARRLARIRLVECEEGEVRGVSPLKENGPDPVVDREEFSVDFLGKLLGRKRVPVKALLLDQGNISGKICGGLRSKRERAMSSTDDTCAQELAIGWRTRFSTKLASTPNNTATPSTPSRSSDYTNRSCPCARLHAKLSPIRSSSLKPG